MATSLRRDPLATAWRVLLVGVLYWSMARLGIDLAIDEQFTPIWIPAGIALVAVLRWGPWMALGVGVGECVASLEAGIDPFVAVALGVGNALEPLVAVAILQRLGVVRAIRRVRHVFALLLAIGAGGLVSGVIGVSAFLVAGTITLDDVPRQLALFWGSVVLGVILIVPFALAVIDQWGHGRRTTGRIAEAWLVAILVAVTSAYVLDGQHPYATVLLYPLFVWAALRFGVLGASGSILLATVVSVAFQLRDPSVLPELGLDQTESILAVQAILATAAVGNLVLATMLLERDASRIETLHTANALAEAQAIAQLGSWEWTAGRDEVRASAEFARIFGIDADAPTTLDGILAHVPAEDRITVERAIAGAVDDNGGFALEHRVHEGADERMVLHAGRMVGRPRGPRRLVATALDVTERTSIDRLRDALIATASHELRTPLTSIVGFADTLMEQWDRFDEQRRLEFLRIIRTQGRRLSTIIDDTLMQSRLDTGALVVNDEPYPVLNAIQEAIALAHVSSIMVECDSSIVAVGSQEHLTQIVLNFLTNAVKYGDEPYAIRVREVDSGARVEVCVIDHGPGIDPAFRERLFERFTRGPGTDTQPGTGLGLSIVRGLAESNGGRVRYDRTGDETIFSVTVRNFSRNHAAR